MRSVAWMTAICAASAAIVAVIVGPAARPAIMAGMLGPLVAVAASWLAVERAFQRNPAQVTGLIMSAFLVKAVGFAAYFVVVLRVLDLPARPFAISFLCYFVGLYAAEAWLLRRLA
jgi:hypothetical protein